MWTGKLAVNHALASTTAMLLSTVLFASEVSAQDPVQEPEDTCRVDGEVDLSSPTNSSTLNTDKYGGKLIRNIAVSAPGKPECRRITEPVYIAMPVGELSGIDIYKEQTAGNYIRFLGASGMPTTQIADGGQFETVAWVTISGNYRDSGRNRYVLPPTNRPYMLGVWSDVFGPTAVFRSNYYAGPEGESWPVSVLSGIGRERLRIDNEGAILFGDISGDNVAGERLQLRLRRSSDTGLLIQANDSTLPPAHFLVERGGWYGGIDALGVERKLLELGEEDIRFGDGSANVVIDAGNVALAGTLTLGTVASLPVDGSAIGTLAWCGECEVPGLFVRDDLGWRGITTRGSGVGSIAIGDDVISSGPGSTAIGAFAKATASGAMAFGAEAVAASDRALAIGYQASAAFENAIAIGLSARASRANQIMLGSAAYTYTMPGVPTAASNGAQSGDVFYLTIDGKGNLGYLTTPIAPKSADVAAASYATASVAPTFAVSSSDPVGFGPGAIAASSPNQITVAATLGDEQQVVSTDNGESSEAQRSVNAASKTSASLGASPPPALSAVTESQFADISARVSALETRVSGFDLRLTGVEGGVAAAMAMGQAKLVPDANVSMTFAAATYGGQQGYAGSISGRVMDKFYVSGSVSGNTGDKRVGGAVSATVGF